MKACCRNRSCHGDTCSQEQNTKFESMKLCELSGGRESWWRRGGKGEVFLIDVHVRLWREDVVMRVYELCESELGSCHEGGGEGGREKIESSPSVPIMRGMCMLCVPMMLT
jgi:hypothetical protein